MDQMNYASANAQLGNEVVKTVSQTLTEAQKNQVCSNLGVERSVLRDVPFTITVSDWETSNGVFTAEFETAYVTATSKDIVFLDDSIRTYGLADIDSEKKTGGGGIVFTTQTKPTGVITGTILSFDNDDGKIPVIIEDTVVSIANGGTGQSSLAGAQQALGITELNDHLANKVDKNSPTSLASIELGPNSSEAGHGGFIDFHYNGSSADYTSRIIEISPGNVEINGISITGLGDSVLLLSGITSYGQFTVPDLKQFRYILVCLSWKSANNLTASTIFPMSLFRNGTVSQVTADLYDGARHYFGCAYSSDTSLTITSATGVSSTTYEGSIYGIK